EYNTSAEDLAKLTSIINQGFIVSGATAQEAENAIIQLSQGIASGVLRGEEFNSVAEQGSRLMVALADSLGVSIGQLRKMAAEGKLTTDVVVKGLLSQGDAIGKEFAKTTRTMSQAFQEAGNNLTKFLGENTTIKASINVFSDAVITASKSLDEMVLAVSLVASVVSGRYIAAMGLAIKAKMQSAVAARQEAIANLQAARVAEHNAIMTARKTALDLAAARALVEKAKTEFAAARGTNAEATALANLIAVRSAATTAAINHKQATQAQTAAMANSAAAARAASVSIGLANKALGFVGGPAGIAMAAGAAIMYFYQQAKEAREEAVKLAEGVNQLTAEMKNMTREQKRAESAKLKEALPELKNEVLNTTVAMKQAAEKVRELEADLALAKVGTSKYESITKQLADAQDKLAIATDNATKASNNYSRTKNTISFIQADLNGELKEGIDLLKREISVLPSGAKGWDSYGFSIDRALQKKKEFNGEKISFEWSKEGMDLRKSLEREMKLANAKSEVDKRLLQVDFYIEDKGITDEREIYQLKQIAIATQKAQDAAAERNKTTKESTKATDAAYEALKRQREEIELLNKGYKDGSLEMAKYDAVKALGDKASPEQIKLAEKLAEDKYNIERNLADKKAALDLDLVTKAKESHDKQLADLERITKDDVSLTEQAARRKAEIEAEYQQKIAEIKANNAVSPQDDIKGKVDPVQQLKNEHERKLALIREFETEKGAITQRGLELMNVANTQYEQDRLNAQWEIWRNQSQANQFLADGLDALGQRSTNVLTGLLTQTQSINDAFRNVALTIVDQAVGALVQMGMQQVKNMVTESAMRKASNAQAIAEATTTGAAITNAMAPAAATTSIATMGSAATWGMAAMAIAIPAMIALAGARKNGGPVNAGSMYRVGEGGKPEIFKASNGSQYMIPGDNGRVISNRQIGKGGNGVSMGDMNFTFQVQAPNGITQKEAQQIQQMVRGTVYDVLGNEMRSGGALEKVRSW
ncbi:TPA: tape measure protein, partial [Proteus mirabilis]